jgi:hypothetical protein
MNTIETLKTIKSGEKTITFFKGKIHNAEGPAIVYDNGKKEYYINGIEYSYDEFKKLKKSREGLPWYKGAARGKARV